MQGGGNKVAELLYRLTREFKQQKEELYRLLITTLAADRERMAGDRLFTRTVDRCLGYVRMVAGVHDKLFMAAGLPDLERNCQRRRTILDAIDEVIPLAPGGYSDIQAGANSVIASFLPNEPLVPHLGAREVQEAGVPSTDMQDANQSENPFPRKWRAIEQIEDDHGDLGLLHPDSKQNELVKELLDAGQRVEQSDPELKHLRDKRDADLNAMLARLRGRNLSQSATQEALIRDARKYAESFLPETNSEASRLKVSRVIFDDFIRRHPDRAAFNLPFSGLHAAIWHEGYLSVAVDSPDGRNNFAPQEDTDDSLERHIKAGPFLASEAYVSPASSFQNRGPDKHSVVTRMTSKRPESANFNSRRPRQRDPELGRLRLKVRQLQKEGLTHEKICARLGDHPRPLRVTWRHLTWPVAYRKHTSAVTKWLSEACSDSR